jgi:hypothetical protein
MQKAHSHKRSGFFLLTANHEHILSAFRRLNSIYPPAHPSPSLL